MEDWGVERSARILVLGDSQLVLDFVACRAKPKVQALALASEKLHLLQHGWGTCMVLQHDPREHNVLADWLTKVARADQASVELTEALQQY